MKFYIKSYKNTENMVAFSPRHIRIWQYDINDLQLFFDYLIGHSAAECWFLDSKGLNERNTVRTVTSSLIQRDKMTIYNDNSYPFDMANKWKTWWKHLMSKIQ